MSDLEDVLTVLYKMEESFKKHIEFVKKLRKLFGRLEACNELGAEQISTTPDALIDIINEALIFGD